MSQALPADSLAALEEVCSVLRASGVDSALIGAMALAAHEYVRATRDIDLATAVDPTTDLRRASIDLAGRGYDVELRYPDEEDPLGGTLRIQKPGALPIEVVNFLNPWTGGAALLAREAIAQAAPLAAGSAVKVVGVAHLVALKLYAGGEQSVTDVLQLLRRNPGVDRADVQAVCSRFGLGDACARVLAALS